MRPHRRQPTRLPCPWDSPGKNTGVGCHFLLQCMKVKSESEVAQSCPTLSDPMGPQLTRLLCPRGFPGKSTGVGCHCLLRVWLTVFPFTQLLEFLEKMSTLMWNIHWKQYYLSLPYFQWTLHNHSQCHPYSDWFFISDLMWIFSGTCLNCLWSISSSGLIQNLHHSFLPLLPHQPQPPLTLRQACLFFWW